MRRLAVVTVVLAGLHGARADAAVPPPRLDGPPSAGFDEGPVAQDDRPTALGLRRLEDGSYLHVDPGRRFTMVIRPDGRVRFADRWKRPSDHAPEHGRDGGRPPEGVLLALNPFAGVKMAGPVEWLLAARGHDAASGAKLDALVRSEAFRTKMAVAWARTRVADALRALPGDLDALWADTTIPLARRKSVLFEHWDACEDRLGIETTGLPDDAMLVVDRERLAAARKARAAIVRFVRKHLAPGTSGAFTQGDLDRLNRRRVSVAPFEPYRAASGDTPS